MQLKLLKGFVAELIGQDSSNIVDILFEKKDINEFLIAKKMNLTINQIRNILYKLSTEGLVSFTRKKDKRKGWYIYFWTLNSEKCLVKIEESLNKKISDLKALLKEREAKRYYVCKPCNIEVEEETALDHGFSCEECAEVYTLASEESYIAEIKNNILKIEKELKTIKNELVMVREESLKKRVRTEGREKAKKKAIRDKNRKAAKKSKLAEKPKKKK